MPSTRTPLSVSPGPSTPLDGLHRGQFVKLSRKPAVSVLRRAHREPGAPAGVGRFAIQCPDGSADWTGKSLGVHGRHRCRHEWTFSVYLNRREGSRRMNPRTVIRQRETQGPGKQKKRPVRPHRPGERHGGMCGYPSGLTMHSRHLPPGFPGTLHGCGHCEAASAEAALVHAAPGSRITVDPGRARFRRARGKLGGFVRGGVSFPLDPTLSRTMVQSRKNGDAYGEKKEGRRT